MTAGDGDLPEAATDDLDGGKVAPGEDFAFFSLNGDRFDAPGMPADTAREVGNFREAVLQVARQLWLSANPDRQRVPNGFTDAFDLRLTEVVSGSARPRLILHRPTRRVSDADWSEWEAVYVKARNVVTEAVHEVGESGHLPADFPRAATLALRRLGTSLVESEAITLGAPKDNRGK